MGWTFQSRTGSTGHSDVGEASSSILFRLGFNPERAPQAIPTQTETKLLEEMTEFQSRTGSTGHSDSACMLLIASIADCVFQSRTGSTGHSDFEFSGIRFAIVKFQSRTGSTGHSYLDLLRRDELIVRFQSRTGSTGHSDKVSYVKIIGLRRSFNPERAPQAIPTQKASHM